MGSSNKIKGAGTKNAGKDEPKAEPAESAIIVVDGGGGALPAASLAHVAPEAVKEPKPAKPAKAAPATKSAKEKLKKPKLVRDSFAMPEAEYDVLRDLKKACIKAGIDIKKSELLRVGVALLKKQTPQEIQAALSELVTLKAGRPKKQGVG